MEFISVSDCRRILEVEYPDSVFNVHCYRFEEFEDHVEGFLSSTKKLVIEFSIHGDSSRKQMCFFAKTLPQQNDFHEEYVRSTNGFSKEVFFFDKIKPNLDLWTHISVIPKCYLAVPDRIVVLELMSDFFVKDIADYFSEAEIKSAIRSLALLHSASMMCESKSGIDPESVWGDHFFETLYLRREDHMGFRHLNTGYRAVKAIIDTHYKDLTKECKNRVCSIYDNMPELILPSKKFRNVVSHGDLYTNNIMLSKSSGDEIMSKIVDFQLFRFYPPALDLLMMIYLTTDCLSNETMKVDYLTDYYYEFMASNMSKFGFEISIELPRDEYDESLRAFRSLALAITLLFQLYVNLPPSVLKKIMDDPVLMRKFQLEDRNEAVLAAFDSCDIYRNKLMTTLTLLFESCNNDVK